MGDDKNVINLDDYEIQEQIGSSSCGNLFKVIKKSNGKYYAAKILNIHVSDGKNQRKILERTLQCYSTLDNPAVVKFNGYNLVDFEGNDLPVIITKYMTNDCLLKILVSLRRKETPKGWNNTKMIINILGISLGMKYLHESGIIHFDLRPSNVLLDENYYPKLTDFGLERLLENINNNFKAGNPYYMAPEKCEDDFCTCGVDVFSFGMILYEFYAKAAPIIPGKTDFQIMKNITKGIRPNLNKIEEGPVKELIQKCWSNLADDRPTFDEIIDCYIKNRNDFWPEDVDEKEVEQYLNKFDLSLDPDKIVDFFIKNLSSESSEEDSDDDDRHKKKKNSKDKDDTYNKLKEENKTLKDEVQKLKEKNKTYENYLLSLKEKSSELTFFDQNEYEEESVIGKGSTSNIKIVHKKEQEKYAMKELVLFDHKSMQRFLGECELLFKLRHPCIIKAYGFNLGDEIHKPSIILSLEPKSLETAIKNNEINNEEKNRITVEIVLGMRYIHKHKFMHRDLKPLNILLNKNNHVRITDFGLAKEEDLSISQSKGVGTLLFMAPELLEEDEDEIIYTNKVDIYSFGIILIYIITDKYPPFSLKRAAAGVLPKLPENISNWIRELITNCLSLEPENRPSFAEIFEIMKSNNFDLFNDIKDKKLTAKQRKMKEIIEARIMKIEAFEFQHQ